MKISECTCICIWLGFTVFFLLLVSSNCAESHDEVIIEEIQQKADGIHYNDIDGLDSDQENIEALFENAEIELLQNPLFYDNGKGEAELIVQIFSQQYVSLKKETSILKNLTQCLFARTLGDNFDLVSKVTYAENTIDGLYYDLKRSNETIKGPPAIIIIDHPNGIVAVQSLNKCCGAVDS